MYKYAFYSRKLQKELGWKPSLQFEEGIEEPVKWSLENQEWMDHVTSGEYQKYYEGDVLQIAFFENLPVLPYP